ncbi:MAG TPA: HEAT repeat domain-containing protein [Halanaerobiales bacterium]|nr:HEAT repeat domain-containing protein [Halanaerobiales bacterium]
MDVMIKVLISLSHFIRQYSFLYFGFLGLFLLLMLILLIRKRKSNAFVIKNIKRLLSKDLDKAFGKIENSNLDIIEYFLNENNLNTNNYIKLSQYLSQPEKIRAIFSKMKAPQKHYRSEVIESGISILSKLSTPQATDYLITFLYEDNQETVKTTLEALSNKQTEKIIYSLIEYTNYVTDNNILSVLNDIFKKMGDRAAKMIIPFIYEAEPTTIIFYIDIIGEHNQKEFYQLLSNLLTVENPEVKIHVIKKLYNYDLDDNTINKIIALLEDKHWGVRSQALTFLGDTKITKALPLMAKKLTDKSGIVRVTATEALMEFGYDGIKYIFELAKKPDAPKELKEALKKQDIAFLIEALENVYQDQDKHHQINPDDKQLSL